MANETVQAVKVEAKLTFYVTGADGAQLVKEHTYSHTFTDGTGTDQAGAVWNDDARSLAATTETLDLDGLVDFQGATMTDNNAVKVMWIENTSTTTGYKLTLGGGDWAGATRFLTDATDKCNVGPSGLLLAISPVDGYAITASTGDGLLEDAGANTVTSKQVFVFDNA